MADMEGDEVEELLQSHKVELNEEELEELIQLSKGGNDEEEDKEEKSKMTSSSLNKGVLLPNNLNEFSFTSVP